MNRMSTYLSRTKKLLAGAALVLATAAFTMIGTATAANISFEGTTKDCDSNAVMFCGALTASSVVSKYKNGDSRNSAGSIHNIFSSFGISSSDIDALPANAIAGHVTKGGDVFAGNTLVATGAMTGGRQSMPGSTKVSAGGTTFYKRSPSVSFRSDSLKAYIVMKNGVFDFAILAACGNPVTATPKTPNYEIVKDVRAKGDSAWQNSVTVQSGAHVEYRVTVKSTGAVAVANSKVTDTTPAGITFVPGSLSRSIGGSVDGFFSTGNSIVSMSPGSAVVYTFEAVVGADDTSTTCQTQTLVNTAQIAAPGLPTESDSATVKKTCAERPAFACTDLTLTLGDNRTVTANVTHTSSNGAVLKNIAYDFGDNSGVVIGTSGTQTHQYAADGQFTVTATPTFIVNGQEIASPSAACTANVNVNTPVTPPTPPTPTTPELPNTGAGEVIGLFGAITIVGALTHRYFIARRHV